MKTFASGCWYVISHYWLRSGSLWQGLNSERGRGFCWRKATFWGLAHFDFRVGFLSSGSHLSWLRLCWLHRGPLWTSCPSAKSLLNTSTSLSFSCTCRRGAGMPPSDCFPKSCYSRNFHCHSSHFTAAAPQLPWYFQGISTWSNAYSGGILWVLWSTRTQCNSHRWFSSCSQFGSWRTWETLINKFLLNIEVFAVLTFEDDDSAFEFL